MYVAPADLGVWVGVGTRGPSAGWLLLAGVIGLVLHAPPAHAERPRNAWLCPFDGEVLALLEVEGRHYPYEAVGVHGCVRPRRPLPPSTDVWLVVRYGHGEEGPEGPYTTGAVVDRTAPRWDGRLCWHQPPKVRFPSVEGRSAWWLGVLGFPGLDDEAVGWVRWEQEGMADTWVRLGVDQAGRGVAAVMEGPDAFLLDRVADGPLFVTLVDMAGNEGQRWALGPRDGSGRGLPEARLEDVCP